MQWWKMPYSNGLARNVTQCLEDYDIPLLLVILLLILKEEAFKSVTIARLTMSEPIRGTSKN